MKLDYNEEKGFYKWLDAPKESPLFYSLFIMEEHAQLARKYEPKTIIDHCYAIRKLTASDTAYLTSITSRECLETTFIKMMHDFKLLSNWKYKLINYLLGA